MIERRILHLSIIPNLRKNWHVIKTELRRGKVPSHPNDMLYYTLRMRDVSPIWLVGVRKSFNVYFFLFIYYIQNRSILRELRHLFYHSVVLWIESYITSFFPNWFHVRIPLLGENLKYILITFGVMVKEENILDTLLCTI